MFELLVEPACMGPQCLHPFFLGVVLPRICLAKCSWDRDEVVYMWRGVRYVFLRRLLVRFLKFGLCRMEERPTSPAPPPNCHYLSLPSPTLAENGCPLPPAPFERAVSLLNHPFQIPECDLSHLLPPDPILRVTSGIGELGHELLAEYKGQKFKHDDLVDVICGTGHGVPGIKSEPIKARFKGVVDIVRGPEFCVDLWWDRLVVLVLLIHDIVCLNCVHSGHVC